MSSRSGLPPQVRWAQMRFAVVGPLLVQEPPAGELQARLLELSQQEWPHPVRGLPVRFSRSTIERWYYRAREQELPTQSLQRVRRKDAGMTKRLDESVRIWLAASYRAHPGWSYQLHYENLRQSRPEADRPDLASYATVRRYMQTQGWRPHRSLAHRQSTPGAMQARERLEQREVRRFEHTHTHALWHIDGHHAPLALSHHGKRVRPVLIATLDDHSRLICHAQWFWSEDACGAAHVLTQAMIKRGLPRMLLSDNGAAYTATEVVQGLSRLGILHETTLCYSPYQNGKMEVFWHQVDGRLMAMLEGRRDLDLYQLNELTQAWIEHEYHLREHRGIAQPPMTRYLAAPHVGRILSDTTLLTRAFTRRESRRQRFSDGSISLGKRIFVVPSRYRHLERIMVRYAEWDLDAVFLTNPDSDAILERLWPMDLASNASGGRRNLPSPPVSDPSSESEPPSLPPILQAALDRARANGLPPAFIPMPGERANAPEVPHAAS